MSTPQNGVQRAAGCCEGGTHDRVEWTRELPKRTRVKPPLAYAGGAPLTERRVSA